MTSAGVADVCADQGLWLHVDGAYGGAAMAAPSTRDRLAGIERADSLVVDPHKWLFANYDCAALLYRDPARRQERSTPSTPTTWTPSTARSGTRRTTRCT